MILTFNGFTIKIIIINDDFKYKIKTMIEIIVIIDDEFRRKCVYIRFFFFSKNIVLLTNHEKRAICKE